jgi:hypothetical protein
MSFATGFPQGKISVISPRLLLSREHSRWYHSRMRFVINDTCKTPSRLASGPLVILLCAALVLSIVQMSFSQSRQITPAQVEEIISRVKAGKFDPMELIQLAQSGDRRAVPILKEQFMVPALPTSIKQQLALGLIKMGDKDPVYWNYLEENAKRAIESDAPDVRLFNSQGKTVPRQLSPEFIAWAESHHLSPDDAAAAQVYEVPGYLLVLAMTGDLRALPLLRKGMSSKNVFIQMVAAKTLAKYRDNTSVPIIIQVCERARPEDAIAIARALPFFDDPRAQNAAEKFITNKELLEELRKLYREKGPEGIF